MAQPHLMLQHLAEGGGRAAGIPGIADDEDEHEYIPLSDFIRAEQEIIHVEDPKGYDRNTSAFKVENRMLAPRIQVLMWLTIDAVNNFIEQDCCLESLDETNIQVSRWTLRPRFHDVRVTKKTSQKIESNMTSLAIVFETTIPANADVPPHFEVTHLIDLMKGGDAESMLFVIRFHPSLVPLQNRSTYLSKMNSYAWDILRLSYPDGYKYVQFNLSFPGFWDLWIAENTHLKDFHDSANDPYTPQGCPATGKSGGHELLRYHRNMPTHTAKVARHTPSPHHMKFTETDTFRMLYSVVHTLLLCMAESLHRLGKLRPLQLQALFPGRIIKM